MIYLANAFSCQMVPEGAICTINSSSLDEARHALTGECYDENGQFVNCVGDFLETSTSIIGHSDVADVVAMELGCPGRVPVNRCSIVLKKDDTVFVAQYIGPRLPEGATRLPEGATIRWFKAKLT